MKNNNYKKITISILISLIVIFLFAKIATAVTYTALEPDAFPGIPTNSSGNLTSYLSAVFNFGIAAAIGLSLIMIIWGGIIKMTTDSWQGKDDAKNKIENAIYGLGIALISWLLLYTINPCLVNFTGTIDRVKCTNTFLQ